MDEMTNRKIDAMIISTFLTTIFYSATYPYIHKEIMENVDSSIIALKQIINCLSIIIFGGLWNKKSEKLFKHYPIFCILETLLSILLTIWTVITREIIAYYMIDTLIFAIVTRNICCGCIKLKAIRYSSEIERENFDNNNNSASAVATIIGSALAMILNLDFSTMLWLATLGGAIDNMSYLFIFRSIQRKK